MRYYSDKKSIYTLIRNCEPQHFVSYFTYCTTGKLFSTWVTKIKQQLIRYDIWHDNNWYGGTVEIMMRDRNIRLRNIVLQANPLKQENSLDEVKIRHTKGGTFYKKADGNFDIISKLVNCDVFHHITTSNLNTYESITCRYGIKIYKINRLLMV
jgi:hypothetical protein